MHTEPFFDEKTTKKTPVRFYRRMRQVAQRFSDAAQTGCRACVNVVCCCFGKIPGFILRLMRRTRGASPQPSSQSSAHDTTPTLTPNYNLNNKEDSEALGSSTSTESQTTMNYKGKRLLEAKVDEGGQVQRGKRKRDECESSEDVQQVWKKSRSESGSIAGPSWASPRTVSSLSQALPEFSVTDTEPRSSNIEEERSCEDFVIEHDEFKKKYKVTEYFTFGGFGLIYKGLRRKDTLPVIIKCVKSQEASWVNRPFGEYQRIPLEVVVLEILGEGSEEQDCATTPLLLDWYKAENNIILVLERPEPCMDLDMYISNRESNFSEEEAQVIFKQLVVGALELKSKGVFHRDIKPDNILIETGQDPPRARFIDFGRAKICRSVTVFKFCRGAAFNYGPEVHMRGGCSAGPSTVWQLGNSLYFMLHRRPAFTNLHSVLFEEVSIREDLSMSCQMLLRGLLDKDSVSRICLEDIMNHPWMTH